VLKAGNNYWYFAIFVGLSFLISTALIPTTAHSHPVIVHYEKNLKQWKAIQCGDAGCATGDTFSDLLPAWTAPIPSSFQEQRSFKVGPDGKPGFFFWSHNAQEFQWLKCGNGGCTNGNTINTIAGVPPGGQASSYFRDSIAAIVQSNNNPLMLFPQYGPIPGFPQGTGTYYNFGSCTTPGCASPPSVVNSFPSFEEVSATLGNDGLPLIVFVQFHTLSALHCGNLACSAGNVTTVLSTDTQDTPYATEIAVKSGDSTATPIITSIWSGEMRLTKCLNHACTVSNTTVLDTAPSMRTGDLTYGSDGLPLLSYYKEESNCPIFPDCIDNPPTVVMHGLRLLHCGNQDCSAANDAQWIDAVNDPNTLFVPPIGGYSDIDIDPIDGLPTIAYQASENLQGTLADLRVVHCNNNSCSGPQSISNVIVDGSAGNYLAMVHVANTGGGTLPSTPTGLTATAVSTSQINLAWNSASGATGYKVYQDGICGTLLQSLGNVLNFSDSGLAAGSSHSYSLKATNSSGDSNCSTAASATTFANLPPTPTGLTATPVSTSQINLAWNISSGATSYKVYHDAICSAGAFLQQVSVTSFQHTGLAASSTHSYAVKANNAAGDSGCSATATTTTFPNLPGVPTGLTATAVSTSQINLAWNAVSGATSYKVYHDGICSAAALLQQVSVTSFQHTGLAVNSFESNIWKTVGITRSKNR
jgi:hypothetical protein